ncbi:hypothetical protein FDI40_gp241 [Agrobacterium phage Atu_ph07]|uniref:Uncharacterized protein n=1 Tax=Agrobacterium phage Atu_ph07 TaxID=2024264 RepID=A0A2L0UZR3_9CAUD|nr:hypothetical protein FDI40_gp241 [Agrobacterium phage Atu_ph07]AUZ95023.1 hypothetical protein [Agrobacterium phage Atu_ph07]
MTEFNFTVRATDNLGAFADREFSINVRNTIVDRWVATVTGGSVITSPDGINWTLQQNIITGTNNIWNNTSSQTTARGSVGHFNGKWYINAGVNYITSTDAKNWSVIPFPSVTYEGNQYVAGSAQTSYVNGEWAKSPTNIGIMVPMYSASAGYYRNILMMTSDGINWTHKWVQTLSTSSGISPQTTKVIYGNGKWLISGNRRDNLPTIGYVSSDEGATWTTVPSPAGAFLGGDIFFVNGKWIATRADIQAMYISDDLINWSYQAYSTPVNTNFRYWNWNYGNGVISVFPELSTNVSGSSWNRVYSTVDLVNWTETTLPVYPVVNNGVGTIGITFVRGNASAFARISSAFYNGQFIFGTSYTSNAATTGGLLSSTDGKTYTKLNLPAAIGNDALIFGIACSSY